MFEFGRDLRKLFDKARESEDLGWLELIGVDLVEIEARREAVDAGRVSCARPFDGWMRASALWREHARRTGRAASLDRATRAAVDAARHTSTPDQTAAAAIEAGENLILRFDLFGGPEALNDGLSALQSLTAERPATRAAAAALHARLSARRARLSGSSRSMMDAAALMDAALHSANLLPSSVADDLRLDRAALALEAGVEARDPRLLDQAGRDLRVLIETAHPDQRPITRARALALAGAGLGALAGMAGDTASAEAGHALFAAGRDQFTVDHSPLDWVAVHLVQPAEDTPLSTMAQCEALTREPGLILGALSRERRVAAEVRLAETADDLATLNDLETVLRRRLTGTPAPQPIDWAADQIGLAHVALAKSRLTASQPRAVGLMLAEAMETARDVGVPALVQRAVMAVPDVQTA